MGQTAFGIDTVPPENLTIVSPSQHETVHTSSVEVHYLSVDVLSGIDGYLVQLDERAALSSGTGLSFKFEGVADGPHTLCVSVIDKAGNEASVSASFRVDTNVFSLSGPYGPMPLLALLATPVLTAVLALLRRSRVRKRIA